MANRPSRAIVSGHPRCDRVLATLSVVALTLFTLPALANILEIDWDSNARFERNLAVPPAKFAEVCGKLPAGVNLRWEFEASAPLDFNVHYHVGKEVVFPAKLKAVASARNTLQTRIEQDYCWMWTNKSAATATLTVKLQR